MSNRYTDITVAPCKLCGCEPRVSTSEELNNDFDPYCEITCYHVYADCAIELSCSTGVDGADCERKAVELWNELMASCESCKHYDPELPICHKRPYENNVGEGSCCPMYEVRK